MFSELFKQKRKEVEENNFVIEIQEDCGKYGNGLRQLNKVLNEMVRVCEKHMDPEKQLLTPADAIKMLAVVQREDARVHAYNYDKNFYTDQQKRRCGICLQIPN